MVVMEENNVNIFNITEHLKVVKNDTFLCILAQLK